jgi:hypothetical protein
MAENVVTQAEPDAFTTMGIAAPIVGWLIPGGGHFLLKRWIRGGLIFISVVSMFLIGLAADGKVYSPNTGDILEMLGFVGNVGAGLLYFCSKMFSWGRGAVQMASAAYGTTFIIVAGLLNIISAVDAHHIAIGKKQ